MLEQASWHACIASRAVTEEQGETFPLTPDMAAAFPMSLLRLCLETEQSIGYAAPLRNWCWDPAYHWVSATRITLCLPSPAPGFPSFILLILPCPLSDLHIELSRWRAPEFCPDGWFSLCGLAHLHSLVWLIPEEEQRYFMAYLWLSKVSAMELHQLSAISRLCWQHLGL